MGETSIATATLESLCAVSATAFRESFFTMADKESWKTGAIILLESVLAESFILGGVFTICFCVSFIVFAVRAPAFALSISDWRKLSFCAKTLPKTNAKNIVSRNFNANVAAKIMLHFRCRFFTKYFLYPTVDYHGITGCVALLYWSKRMRQNIPAWKSLLNSENLFRKNCTNITPRVFALVALTGKIQWHNVCGEIVFKHKNI